MKSFLPLLGAILIVLKVLEVSPTMVEMSWWLVLLPFYLGLAIVVAVVVIGGVGVGVAGIVLIVIEKMEDVWRSIPWVRTHRAKRRATALGAMRRRWED